MTKHDTPKRDPNGQVIVFSELSPEDARELHDAIVEAFESPDFDTSNPVWVDDAQADQAIKAWLDAEELYGSRGERFYEISRNGGDLGPWLREAYKLGLAAGRSDSASKYFHWMDDPDFCKTIRVDPPRMTDDLWEQKLADERAEDDHPGMDETEYLMQGAKGERMMRALAQLNAGQGRDEHGNPVTWHTGFPDIQALDVEQLKFPDNRIPDDLFDMMEMLDADDYGLNDDQVTLFDKDGNPESPAFHRGYSHGMKRISEIMDTPHYQRIQEMYFREFLTPQERDAARQDLIETNAKIKAAMEPYSRGLHPRVAAIREAVERGEIKLKRIKPSDHEAIIQNEDPDENVDICSDPKFGGES